MRVLGISGFYHDSAVALVDEGRVVAAAQEERFTRKKHDASFPSRALSWLLTESATTLADVDRVVFYEKPFIKFERLLQTYLGFAPRGFRSFRVSAPRWMKERLFLRSVLGRELRAVDAGFDPERLLFAEHHQSHAASAFYPSPFERAATLTMDGVGEWTTTSMGVGRGRELSLLAEIHFPHSLGLLYSAFTQYTGFRVNSGEYKVMGLAPYGEPRYVDTILEHVVDLKDDGSFHLDMQYFDYCTGLSMVNRRFEELFGGPTRKPETPIEQRHKDLAASVQAVVERAVLRQARHVASETEEKNLCLAGGVALNCVANGELLRSGTFERIWIQPAAGDAGGALGAALAGYHLDLERDRTTQPVDGMEGAYLGPGFSPAEVRGRLDALGARYETLARDALLAAAVDALSRGQTIGWFQGRMEYGPRALGARSILADARAPDMQDRLNEAIKRREPFRPFAPAVLRESVADWFELDADSPYMLLVAGVNEARRTAIPAVTHVDGSARVQTVHAETNPLFHALLSAFDRHTGCPVLLNTSFNVRGEPIVCTPEDAWRCFMGTELDVLITEDCFLRKSEQA